MTDLNDQWHVSLDDLDEYFEGKLPSQKEAEIDTHFAECLRCTERAKGTAAVYGYLESMDSSGSRRDCSHRSGRCCHG